MYRSQLCFALFPYTTLFRSVLSQRGQDLSYIQAKWQALVANYQAEVSAYVAEVRAKIDQYVSESQTLRSEEHTSELQSRPHLVCRLLLAKKKSRSAYCCSS